ncbi:unnamed protein product [Penicillium bialowiezense]
MEMSLNNPPYPLSSSSSRQSLNKEASRPDTASTRPVSVVSPCQDTTLDPVEDHPEEGHERPASNPAFQPFFTLVEDAHTSDYHHPTVHYIFSDDDSDIVTEAALRSLSAQQESLSDSKKEQIAHNTTSPYDEIKDPSDSVPAKTTLLPPSVPGVRENYLILDVEPCPMAVPQDPILEQLAPGKTDTKSLSSSPANQPTIPPEGQHQYRVTGAQSFSSTWQVLNTEVVAAPTFENSNPGESPGHGLMLKIRGTSGLPDQRIADGEGRGGQRLEDMMDQFAKRMGELQVVIDAAETASANAHADGEEAEHPIPSDAIEATQPHTTVAEAEQT